MPDHVLAILGIGRWPPTRNMRDDTNQARASLLRKLLKAPIKTNANILAALTFGEQHTYFLVVFPQVGPFFLWILRRLPT